MVATGRIATAGQIDTSYSPDGAYMHPHQIHASLPQTASRLVFCRVQCFCRTRNILCFTMFNIGLAPLSKVPLFVGKFDFAFHCRVLSVHRVRKYSLALFLSINCNDCSPIYLSIYLRWGYGFVILPRNAKYWKPVAAKQLEKNCGFHRASKGVQFI